MKALGKHLLLELYECERSVLNDATLLRECIIEAAREAGATIVNSVFHEFSPVGVSGVVVIAESHLAVHTWPEYRYAAVDIFTCSETMRPERAIEYLARLLKAQKTSLQELPRGVFPDGLPEPSRSSQ